MLSTLSPSPASQRKSWFALVFALMIVFAACAGSPHRESTGEYIDDAALTTKVKAALVADKEVSALAVNVETFKGVVQLAGFANSQHEIDRAVQVAKDVKGVKSVKNDLRIKAPG